MLKTALILVSIVALSACDMTWKRPLEEKKSTRSAYEKCLEENPNDRSRCDLERENYDDSMRNMEGLSEDPHSEGGLYDR